MIITCPSCSTRYPVDASSFAPAGRKVRCAKCGHSWHQAPPTDLGGEPVPSKPEDVDVAAAAPEAAAVAEFTAASSRKKIFGDKAKPSGDDTTPSEAAASPADQDVVFADPVPDTRPDIGNRFRAQVHKAATMRRGKVLVAAGWVALALFVGGTLAGGYTFRHDIAALWPATTKVYAAVGEPINLRGLEFRNVVYERQTEEGLPVLAISGEVVNVSGKTLSPPRLRVGLRDGEQNELYHWTFALTQTGLEPEEAAPFITRLSSPPLEARDIEVRFVQKMDLASARPLAPAEDVPPPGVDDEAFVPSEE